MSREKLLVVAAQAVDGLGLLLFLKLITVVFSKDELGTYFLAASVLAFLTSCGFSVLDQGVMRQLHHSDREGMAISRRYALVILPYCGLLAVTALALWLAAVLVPGLSALRGLIAAFIAWMCCEVLKNSFLTFFTAQRRRGAMAAAKLIENMAKIGLVAACAMLGLRSAGDLLWVVAFSSAVVVVALSLLMRGEFGHFQLRPAMKYFERNLRFVWPLFVWAGFSWMQNMSNRWLLQAYVGGATVADYSVIVTVGSMPITFLAAMVASYAVPIIYARADAQGGEAASRFILDLLSTVVPLLAGWCLVAAIFHGELMRFFASARYAESSSWLPAVAVGAGFQALGGMLSYQSFARNQTSKLLLANIVPGVACLLVGLLIVPRMGLGGAILAFLCSNLLFFLLHVTTFARSRRPEAAGTEPS